MRALVVALVACSCTGPGSGDDQPPPATGSSCGDGIVDVGELCDDGNTVAGDGCRADCGGMEVCGDGMLDNDEQCDDGNTYEGDACAASCALSTCGDGTATPGELCWGPIAAFPIAHGHQGGAIVDLDGDGTLDSVSAGDHRLSLLFGNGAGGFGPSFGVVQPLADAHDVFAFDADGDGDSDLAVIGGRDANPRGIAILANDGSGKQFATSLVELDDWPDWGITTDVDGDGDTDVVVHTYYPSANVVVVTNEGGRFAIASTASAEDALAAGPVIADFDGDGDNDLAYLSGNPSAVEVWTNDGGAFARGPLVPIPEATSLFVIDGNRDAHPDLFATGDPFADTSFLLGNGDGTFSVTPAAGMDLTPESAAGDVDGDGDLDLVEVTNSYAAVHYNDGNFAFRTSDGFAAGYSTEPHLADLDGDGALDVIAGGGFADGWLHAVRNVAGKLVRPEQVQASEYPGKAIVAVDLTTGGALELLALESYSIVLNEAELAVYTKGAGETFTRSATFVGGIVHGLATADITGDGKPDAVVTLHVDNFSSPDKYELRVYPGTGAGGFGTPQIVTLTAEPKAVITGDIDGDNRADIVFTDGSNVRVSRTVGGSASTPTQLPVAGPHELALADLDRDGDRDLVVTTLMDVRVFTNNAGTFTPAAPVALRNGFALATLDLDGDGDSDFIVEGYDSTTYVAILRNNGGTLVPEMTELPADIDDFTIADVDRDGDPDVVGCADGDHDEIRIYRNTAGALALAARFSVGRDPAGCVAPDLDGDGIPELAATNSNIDHVSVLWSRR